MPSKVLVPRPDLVEQDQAAPGRMVQDIRRLFHLDHERRLAAGERIGRADARKDAVDNADLRLGRRHKAAHLGEDHDQRDSGACRSTYPPYSAR